MNAPVARELLQAMNELCLAAWEALDRGDDEGLLKALDGKERLQEHAGDVLRDVGSRRAGERSACDDEVYALALGLHLWNGRLEKRIRARREEVSIELRQLQFGARTLSGYSTRTGQSSHFQAVG